MRLEAFVNGLDDFFPGLALFNVAVDAVLDEDFLERREVPLLLELAPFDFEFEL